MKIKKANKLFKQILKEDDFEIGNFISLLSHEYLIKTGMSKTDFLEKVRNSLKLLKTDNKDVNLQK